MAWIYLVSEIGAAKTRSESFARALEAMGFSRCAWREYRQHARQLSRKHAKAAGQSAMKVQAVAEFELPKEE